MMCTSILQNRSSRSYSVSPVENPGAEFGEAPAFEQACFVEALDLSRRQVFYRARVYDYPLMSIPDDIRRS